MMSKTLAATLSAVLLFSAASASATSLTYTTTGLFSSSGTSVVTAGSGGNTAEIDYLGITNSYTFSGSTNANFGDFISKALGTGATFSPQNFTLTVNQTLPAPTSGNPQTFAANFSGTITPTSNGVLVNFTNTTGSIFTASGRFDYQLANPVILVPPGTPTTPPGDTTLQGVITFTPGVPEPATVAITGIGLVGLGLIRRRRTTCTPRG